MAFVKREWSERANPPYMTLFPWKLFLIYSRFCVILRGYIKGRHLIGQLEWRHLILNLAGNSFHCLSRTASDMTRKLGITFADESKYFEFYVEKSGQSNCRRAKRSWLVKFAWESGSDSTEIANWGLLRTKTRTVSSGDIHAHPRAVIPSFGSNRGHVTRK